MPDQADTAAELAADSTAAAIDAVLAGKPPTAHRPDLCQPDDCICSCDGCVGHA